MAVKKRWNVVGVVALFVALIVIIVIIVNRNNGNQNAKGAVRIEVLQYVDHPALNASREAFLARLEELKLKNGVNGVSIVVKNAQGDPTVMQNVVLSVDPNTDVIFTLATPISQAIKKRFGKSKSISLVYGIITEPVSAGLVDSYNLPGGNNTATSDQWPYQAQMELIREILPNARTVGVLLNPGEVNTQYAIAQTRKAAKAVGISLREVPITGINDVPQAMLSVVDNVDAIYVPSDNTAMASAATIIRFAHAKKVPVFAGDPGTFKLGAVAGLGVSYSDLGRLSAEIVRKIIDCEDAGRIPVGLVQNPTLMLNQKAAKALGIEFSKDLVKRAEKVVD